MGMQFESSSGCGAGQGGGIARVVAETGQCMMTPPNAPPPTAGASCNIKIRCGPVMSGGWHCGVIAPNGVEYGLGGGSSCCAACGTAKPYPPPNVGPQALPPGDKDYPVSCPGQSCPQVQKSIQNYHDTVKPPPYFATGPNSNTYAHNMLNSAGCSVDPIPQAPVTVLSPCGPVCFPQTFQPPPTTTPPNAVGW